MIEKYILAIDQGTTSSRAIIFDRKGDIIGQVGKKHNQIFPKPGWVSHNANEIYENVVCCCKTVLKDAAICPSQISAIGITNQRETIVAWDKETGETLCDAIVWQCRRSADICKKINKDGMGKTIRNKTGLLNDPYFSGTKIKWLIENDPKVQEALKLGRLLVGTIDCFLLWKFTNRKVHATDYTNASRTMLFNIRTLEWDKEILKYFEIPENILPEVLPSSGLFGEIEKEVLGETIPITGIAGDQHAALFGQTCFGVGDAKNTYGTGCFLLVNTGNEPVISDNGLIATIAWNIGGKTTYALEGSVFNAGSSIEWLIYGAKLAKNVYEINNMSQSVKDTGGVYLVPAFSGLGTPHWDTNARASIFGMNLLTNNNHIVRAAMESIAFSVKDVLKYMSSVADLEMGKLNVDGGASKSNFLMQFQADTLGIEVIRPKMIETTAVGVAYLAGLSVGYWESMKEIKKNSEVEIIFKPQIDDAMRSEKYRYWLKAVERSKEWIER